MPKDKATAAQKIVKVGGKIPTTAIAEPAKARTKKAPKAEKPPTNAIAPSPKTGDQTKIGDDHIPDNKVRLPRHVIAMGRKRAEMLGIPHPSSVLAGMITLADKFYGLGPCVVLTIPIVERFKGAIARYQSLSASMRSAKAYTLSPNGFEYIEKLQPGLVAKLKNAGHLKAFDQSAIAEHLAIIDAELADVKTAIEDAAKTV